MARFKVLMRKQVQENVNDFFKLAQKPIPKKGWIRTIRDALGMSSKALASRIGCTQPNIMAMETRERSGSISLNALEEAARAMNCKLVYCFVPLKPLDQIIEGQARLVAKKQIRSISHSMKLEQQELSPKQLQQEEDDLVEELLNGNHKNIWDTNDI